MNYFNRLWTPSPLSALSAPFPNLYSALSSIAATPPHACAAMDRGPAAIHAVPQQPCAHARAVPRRYNETQWHGELPEPALLRLRLRHRSQLSHRLMGQGYGHEAARDVDLYFLLPVTVYNRFQTNVWNRQSALLQEVKGVPAETYPDTDMSADGQVVVVRFGSYNVEVVPAFVLTNGRYWICNTKDGGSYKETDPFAERYDAKPTTGVLVIELASAAASAPGCETQVTSVWVKPAEDSTGTRTERSTSETSHP